MKQTRLPLGVFASGIVLIVLSVMWPRWTGGRAVWTDADARAHAAAAADLHGQFANHNRELAEAPATAEDPATDVDTLAAARERFDASQARLDAARTRGLTTAALIRWLGIVMALAGALAFLIRHHAASNE